MSKQKELEHSLACALQEYRDIPQWEDHYHFNRPENNMEFDFAWPEYKVAIEINGGQWSRGKMGHNSGSGVERDARKANYAALRGWVLLVFVTDHIEKRLDTYTMPTIRRVLQQQGAPLREYDHELVGCLTDRLLWEETGEEYD